MDLSTIEHDLEIGAAALAKVKSIYQQVAACPELSVIEARITFASAFFAKMGGFAAVCAVAPEAVVAIETAISAYEIAKSYGLNPKPADCMSPVEQAIESLHKTEA